METETSINGDYGPQRLGVELANICNLHCSYCFRADGNLYSPHAEFFPVDLLRRIIGEARSGGEYHAGQLHRWRANSSSRVRGNTQSSQRSRFDCQLCYQWLALRSYLACNPGESRFSV